jgi:DNA-binding transcriptional regulator GbsR (MarR family)
MALAELEKWSAVMRTWIPGVRRDYFVAESDIWKMVQRVMRERELTLVVDFGQSVRVAENQVSDLEKDADADLHSALTYKRDRLRRLSDLSRTGETLLKALVAGDSVDPTLLIQRPR